MRPPNNRHSDPRKTHIQSFSLGTPVWVQPWSPGCGLCGTATSVIGCSHLLGGLGRRLARTGGAHDLDGFDRLGVVRTVTVAVVVVTTVIVVRGVGVGRRFESKAVDA